MKPSIIETPAYHRDNGFFTREAQEKAHDVVVAAIEAACAGLEQPKVIDLGCGNGALLAKARGRIPGLIPYGVEINPVAAEHWPEVLPGAPPVYVGDLFEFSFHERYDVALLMPGRLIERPEDAGPFFERLRSHVGCLVVYAYGDWLTRYGSLYRLWDATGMPGRVAVIADNDLASAGLVSFDAS